MAVPKEVRIVVKGVLRAEPDVEGLARALIQHQMRKQMPEPALQRLVDQASEETDEQHG